MQSNVLSSAINQASPRVLGKGSLTSIIRIKEYRYKNCTTTKRTIGKVSNRPHDNCELLL